MYGVYRYEGWNPSVIIQRGREWVQHSGFRKIYAGIDMLLVKARGHEFSTLRVATLSSRYSQCSTLASLKYIWDQLTWDIDWVATFIWVESVIKELIRLVNPNEKFLLSDSYLPYVSIWDWLIRVVNHQLRILGLPSCAMQSGATWATVDLSTRSLILLLWTLI